MTALLEVTGLEMRFGGLVAVDRLDLAARAREITAIIGPNGAGKTSLFNCLTGFYRPTAGRITLGDVGIASLAPHKITRLGLARTFQNIRLFKEMTVLENVMSGRHCRSKYGLFAAIAHLPGQRREEKKIVEESRRWLEFVGISRLESQPAGSLSYGDQRRVEWARALAS